MATRTHRSLLDLQSEIAALQKQAAEARKREVTEVIANIKLAIKAYELTAADLGLRAKRRRIAQPEGPSAKPEGKSVRASRTVAKSGKVAPKYKDEAGNTWTGRGRKPRWLTAALKSGRKLEEFALWGRRRRRAGDPLLAAPDAH